MEVLVKREITRAPDRKRDTCGQYSLLCLAYSQPTVPQSSSTDTSRNVLSHDRMSTVPRESLARFLPTECEKLQSRASQDPPEVLMRRNCLLIARMQGNSSKQLLRADVNERRPLQRRFRIP